MNYYLSPFAPFSQTQNVSRAVALPDNKISGANVFSYFLVFAYMKIHVTNVVT